jgi:hypothetical protein
MLIRFTEFFKKDQEEISLYIIQESDTSNYTVHISNGNKREILLFKKMWNRWSILTRDIPQWVEPFKLTIVRTIEYRLFMGFDRLKIRFNVAESPRATGVI